jgi:hypothetical protein
LSPIKIVAVAVFPPAHTAESERIEMFHLLSVPLRIIDRNGIGEALKFIPIA